MIIFKNEFKAVKAKYRATRNPIVLCHGLLGFERIKIGAFEYQYWNGIQEELEKRGARVLSDTVSPWGSIEDRAKALREMILSQKDGFEQVNLVGHSMGGLDARYLVSKLIQPEFKVLSVTTVATPHHGTYLADLALPLTSHLPGFMGAFKELSQQNMKQFNKDVPNDPRVSYFSYGAMARPSWISPLWRPWHILKQHEGENDGLVSVESSKWGQYQGTLDNVDHVDLVNLSGYKKKTRNWDYNAAAMYLKIMDDLAEMGF